MNMYAVIGESLKHTLSPQIHQFIFKHLNLNYTYGVIEANFEYADQIVQSLKVLNFKGANVTIPYKETLMPHIDIISKEAEAIGAINTIHIKDQISYGYNTDYYGFDMMLKHEHINIEQKDITIIGAGGAAKAIIALFHDSGANSITVVARNQEKLKQLKKQFSYIQTGILKEHSYAGDIVVNTTPIGMYPTSIDESPLSAQELEMFKVAVDIVYNPLETKFLKLAKNAGLKTVSGLYMLIYQAIKAEEIFQGQPIDLDIGNQLFEQLSQLFL